MAYRNKLVSTTIILVVFFVLYMGARAKWADAVIDNQLQSEAPPYAARGPSSVGTRNLVIDGEKPLEISTWYPALKGANFEDAITYSNEMKMGDPFGSVPFAAYAGRANQDVPYDLSAGPYPLVVLSPGFSISSSTYAWLAEHLASYGFVIIAPEHREHLDPENELWRTAITRPQDILTVFSYVDEQVESEGIFAGLIDNDLVAVVGHSYGGYTSLAAAGAQIDTVSFKTHCESAKETNSPGVWLCEQLLPHLADMASLAGLESVPVNLWPSWADPRLDAIVPLAGDAFFFGRNGLKEVTLPVMAIGGTLDSDSPYMWGTHPTYEFASSSRKVRVALDGAEHMIFTGPCEKIPWYLKFFSGEFCSDSDWNRAYAHNLTKHFTTAFLLSELKQDKTASDVLATDEVNFPGVTYNAHGY